jgi:hypothetical protein
MIASWDWVVLASAAKAALSTASAERSPPSHRTLATQLVLKQAAADFESPVARTALY